MKSIAEIFLLPYLKLTDEERKSMGYSGIQMVRSRYGGLMNKLVLTIDPLKTSVESIVSSLEPYILEDKLFLTVSPMFLYSVIIPVSEGKYSKIDKSFINSHYLKPEDKEDFTLEHIPYLVATKSKYLNGFLEYALFNGKQGSVPDNIELLSKPQKKEFFHLP